MAVNLNSTVKYRPQSLLSNSFSFRRQQGKIKTKKIQRKIKVKFGHLVLAFFFLVGIFVLIQQIYLFLISWNYFEVKNIEVVCQKTELQQQIKESLQGKEMGNIFLLNIERLQNQLERNSWVKSVYIRKIFPASLKINIETRKPLAVIKQDNFYLIDRDGVFLEKINRQDYSDLPLLVDSNNFQQDFKDKLCLAWVCLDSLLPSQRNRVEALDLSDYENVSVRLKGLEMKLKLGCDHFSEKLSFFQDYLSKLEKFRPLEYVDLRFEDRLYLKPLLPQLASLNSNSEKEEK